MSYALKSLLAPDEASLAASVQTVLNTFRKPGYRLIYKFQPSTFLHRDRVESIQPSAMKAFFEGIILIGVVEDKIKGSLLCAVLDKRNEYSNAMVDLLGEFKIPCLLCDLTQYPVSIENELRSTLKVHLIRLKALVTAYRREHSTLNVPESVLQQMYLTIYEELEDLGWEAHGIEGGVRSMNKAAAIEIPNGDMLSLTRSSVQDFEVDSQNASAILKTPFGDWTIRLPTPRIRYLGNVLPGFEQDYKAAIYSWMEGMVHRVAHQILVKEKVPTAISEQKLRKCRAHWRRPWNAPERKELFRMRDEGFTVKQIAEKLDRSEYAVAVRVGQNCDHGALLRQEVEEAIRLA